MYDCMYVCMYVYTYVCMCITPQMASNSILHKKLKY